MLENSLFDVPIVLIAYNRPEYVRRQMEILCRIKPQKLYFVVDAAKNKNPMDASLVEEVKDTVNMVCWKCKIIKLYAEQNMGCDRRVVSGLNEVFKQEDVAIILEDDCLPAFSFFEYCKECLKKYKDNKDIMYISGSNWIEGYELDYSYGFSFNTGTWGWATWRRAWNEWHWNREQWDKEKGNWLKGIYSRRYRKNYIKSVERYIEKDSIPWDYVWLFCVGKRLSIFPKYNLIENVGFDLRATHTIERPSNYSGQTKELENIIHPPRIEVDYIYPKLIEKHEKRTFFMRVINYIKRKMRLHKL